MEARDSSETSAKKHKSSDTIQEDAIEENDRISNFPEPVLHYILSFLPTIYVVRTSVLSRRWRHLWNSMPYLDFDHILFPVGREIRGSYQAFRRKFMNFVKWVLIFRDGSNIQKFRLSCFDYCNSRTVDRWVHVVSRRNVQELDISIHPQRSFGLPRCLLASESLKVLKLNLVYGVLELPNSMGFSRLTALYLVSVKLSDDSSVRGLFSSCPLLEVLSMKMCILDNLKVLDISAVNLKNLTIENVNLNGCESCDGVTCFVGTDGLLKTTLMVSAPKLLYFKYMGPLARDYSLQNLSSAVDVFIHIVDYQDWCRENHFYLMSKLLRGFYNAKALRLSTVCLECLFPVLDTPGCYLTQFYHLKSLKLTTGDTECHIQMIIHLLKCSPNIEALVIYFEPFEWEDHWVAQDEPLTCLTFHLKMVEIRDLSGGKYELELVKFLLKNGRVLQKMIVTCFTDPENQIELIQKRLDRLSFPLECGISAKWCSQSEPCIL